MGLVIQEHVLAFSMAQMHILQRCLAPNVLVDPSKLEDLFPAMQQCDDVPRNTILLQEGKPASQLIFLLEGELKMTKRVENSNRAKNPRHSTRCTKVCGFGFRV
jgi:CRP-like cAMP-binding protein